MKELSSHCGVISCQPTWTALHCSKPTALTYLVQQFLHLNTFLCHSAGKISPAPLSSHNLSLLLNSWSLCTLPIKCEFIFHALISWNSQNFTFEDEIQEGAEGVFRVGVEDWARQTGSECGDSSEASRLDLLTRCLKHLQWNSKRGTFFH